MILLQETGFKFSTIFSSTCACADVFPRCCIPVADTLSRNGARDGSAPDDLGLDVYVDAILKQMPVSDEKLEQIRNASKDDSELQELQKHLQQGWPDSPKDVPAMIRPYWNYRDEITAIDGLNAQVAENNNSESLTT